MGSPTARGKRGKLLLWLELRRRRRRRKASGEGKRITVMGSNCQVLRICQVLG